MERGSSGAHRSRRSRRSHLIPVIDRAEQAVGTGPRRVLADAGRGRSVGGELRAPSGAQHRRLHLSGPRREGVESHPTSGDQGDEEEARHQTRASYMKRKHVIEPVLGWIKAVRGFVSFCFENRQGERGVELGVLGRQPATDGHPHGVGVARPTRARWTNRDRFVPPLLEDLVSTPA